MELRVGNRGYTGSPAADTYRCADGWLSTAANTPQQFRRLASVLGLDALCEDATLLDLDAFNAPEGGFVAARDASALQRLQACLAEAFAARSARDMEARLNAVGVPAARVRRLGEFLGEARAAGTVSPVSYGAGGAAVDTRDWGSGGWMPSPCRVRRPPSWAMATLRCCGNWGWRMRPSPAYAAAACWARRSPDCLWIPLPLPCWRPHVQSLAADPTRTA